MRPPPGPPLVAPGAAGGRGRAVRQGETVWAPTVREIRAEMVSRYGRGLSFRDIGRFSDRYFAESDAARQLPVRTRQRQAEVPPEGEEADARPARVRPRVDRALGAMDNARAALARVLAEEVTAETQAVRRRIAQLEAEVAELNRLLADPDDVLAAADEAEERVEAARRDAKVARELTGRVTLAVVADRTRAEQTEERLAAARAGREQAAAALASVTAALDGEREARAADRRTIKALSAVLWQAGLQPSSDATRAGRGTRTGGERTVDG